MLRLADRMVKTLSDVTIGTMIVLVHVALAERTNTRRLQSARDRAELPTAN